MEELAKREEQEMVVEEQSGAEQEEESQGPAPPPPPQILVFRVPLLERLQLPPKLLALQGRQVFFSSGVLLAPGDSSKTNAQTE